MGKYTQQELDQLQCAAIDDVLLMPAVTEQNQLDRMIELGNLSHYVENSFRFQTDQWVD